MEFIVRKYGWDSVNTSAISRELLHISRSTAAIVTSLMTDVPTVYELPAFTSVAGVSHPSHLMDRLPKSAKLFTLCMKPTRIQ